MKKILVILILILFASTVTAQELVNDYNAYSSLDMKFKLDSQFKAEKKSEQSDIEFINANLSFLPKHNDGLELISFKSHSSPEAQITISEDTAFFRWENPSNINYAFGFEGDVRVKNILLPVREKLPFPTQDSRYPEFTQATQYIDISPDIRRKAAELAAGEDDMYVVTFKIAEWVEKNIEYDLTTLTAKAVKESSWVLDNRRGVCDELTNLFISMTRSLGIPSRFVSGMAYTNLGHQWGPHGWAEVYFPDQGWIPFDVTYGQYGWVDPSHIKLKSAADSGDPSVRYLWRAYDIQFKSEQPTLSTELLEKGKQLESPIPFRVRPLVNNVGPGSYVPLEVTAINTQDHYIPQQFVVTKAQELTERNVKRVLFKPGETKKIYWISQMPTEVQPGYSYYTFVEIEDYYHTTARTNISYSIKGKHYSLEEAETLIGGLAEEGSTEVGLECTTTEYAFSYEDIKVNCELSNKKDEFIRDVEVCALADCQTTDLKIGESKELSFTLRGLEAGIRSIDVSAQNSQLNVKESVIINVLTDPDLVVTNFEVPPIVDYNSPFNINFIMSVSAPVHSVKIIINDEEVTQIEELQSSKKVVIGNKGSNYVKRGTANITISFKDRNDKVYSFKQGAIIKVDNIPIFVKVLLWLRII